MIMSPTTSLPTSTDTYSPHQVISKLSTTNDSSELLLKLIFSEYKRFQILAKWSDKLFSYLNKFYAPSSKLPSIKEKGNLFILANIIFQEFVIYKNEDLLLATVCKQLNQIRSGLTDFHQILLSDIIKMLLFNDKKYEVTFIT
jgi:hypothetical protein